MESVHSQSACNKSSHDAYYITHIIEIFSWVEAKGDKVSISNQIYTRRVYKNYVLKLVAFIELCDFCSVRSYINFHPSQNIDWKDFHKGIMWKNNEEIPFQFFKANNGAWNIHQWLFFFAAISQLNAIIIIALWLHYAKWVHAAINDANASTPVWKSWLSQSRSKRTWSTPHILDVKVKYQGGDFGNSRFFRHRFYLENLHLSR